MKRRVMTLSGASRWRNRSIRFDMTSHSTSRASNNTAAGRMGVSTMASTGAVTWLTVSRVSHHPEQSVRDACANPIDIYTMALIIKSCTYLSLTVVSCCTSRFVEILFHSSFFQLLNSVIPQIQSHQTHSAAYSYPRKAFGEDSL
jgi:hypothetical protein